MGEIRFKTTRRLHDSGFRMLDKSGDLEYDLIHPSVDAIRLTITEPTSIGIDCEKDGTYRLFWDERKTFKHNDLPKPPIKGKDKS